MIERLLVVLAAADLEPDPRELRDALWLAGHIAIAEGANRTVPSLPEPRVTAEPLPSPTATSAVGSERVQKPSGSAQEPTAPAEATTTAKLYAAGSRDSGSGYLRAMEARSPAVPALRHQLPLARALKPFKRRVPSRTSFMVDEAATAARVAEEGIWLPVLRPAPARWLDLALVVDASPSMIVWRRTLAELQMLAERLGAFRIVRVLAIDGSTDPAKPLTVHPGSLTGGPAIGLGRDPATLIDASRRQAILVVTDAVSSAWRDGRMDKLLRRWGAATPVAVATVLPQRMWAGTGIRAVPAQLHAPTPGLANGTLRARARSGHGVATGGVPIPVMELSARWLGQWAHIVAGAPDWRNAALLTNPVTVTAPAPALAAGGSGAEIVRRFRTAVSPTAFQLACYLSAAWLNLPVMRLVQRVMLPKSDTSHLAEVFLGGLLRAIPTRDEIDPEIVQYDFLPGVRDELNNYLLRDEMLDVLRQTSQFVAERFGQPFDFAALLADPEGTPLPALAGEGGPPLAHIAAVVLAKLGGRYRSLADRLATAGPAVPSGPPPSSIDSSAQAFVANSDAETGADSMTPSEAPKLVYPAAMQAEGPDAMSQETIEPGALDSDSPVPAPDGPGTPMVITDPSATKPPQGLSSDLARSNARIVFIHGEGQQTKSTASLVSEWSPAVSDALRAVAADYPEAFKLASESSIRLVFYGDVFRPSERMLGLGESWPDPADTTQFEREILQQQGRAAAELDPEVIQPEESPRAGTTGRVQAALQYLRRSPYFGGLTERTILNGLRDLSRYFAEPAIRAAVQQRVAEAVGESTQVIVAHSLGTVVAYEALCAHPEWPVRCLVTLGSPLGMRLVLARLQPPPRRESEGAEPVGHWPGGLETWTNIADVNDLVAMVKDLRPLFGPRVICRVVDNGARAHAVRSYLSAPETGKAILSGLIKRPQPAALAELQKPHSPQKSQAPARRFLLTCVIGHYHNEPSWDRAELAQDLDRMVTLFVGDLGYEHVPIMGLDPTQQQIHDALREFCTSSDRQPDDYIVVYLTGHGEVLPIGDTNFEHVLLPADAIPTDLRRRVVKTGDLAEWILADTLVRRLLLVVDTCFSGQGGLDFAQKALAHIGTPTRLARQEGSAVVVVTATQPQQQAQTGAFTAAFARAVRREAASTQVPEALSIEAVLNRLKGDPELPPFQQAQWTVVANSGAIPAFLPNPRRAEGMLDQFLPSIAGFAGRHRALVDIVTWLGDPASSKVMIVTGDPGSGKTAVLGFIAALSDPKHRPTIPSDGLPASAVPREDAIRVAINAAGMTTGKVLAELATATGIEGIDPESSVGGSDLTRLLSGIHQRSRPMVALIDALDEAVDPGGLITQLLLPLIQGGGDTIRMLLGTRRHLIRYLGRDWQGLYQVIDLDSGSHADPVAMGVVIRRILVGGSSGTDNPAASSPLANLPPARLEAVIAAIAEAAGHSFLIARILAASQASHPALPDPGDPVWRDNLPKTIGSVVSNDLESRLGGDAARAVDLMCPLAYARGNGLPWKEIWTLLANSLTPGRAYTDDDLLWLRLYAGSYIVEGEEFGRSVYRLYHRALVEYLRSNRDTGADETAITKALNQRVPRSADGQPDLQAAHPYIRNYLPSHAQAARDVGVGQSLADPSQAANNMTPWETLLDLVSQAQTRLNVALDALQRAMRAMRQVELRSAVPAGLSDWDYSDQKAVHENLATSVLEPAAQLKSYCAQVVSVFEEMESSVWQLVHPRFENYLDQLRPVIETLSELEDLSRRLLGMLTRARDGLRARTNVLTTYQIPYETLDRTCALIQHAGSIVIRLREGLEGLQDDRVTEKARGPMASSSVENLTHSAQGQLMYADLRVVPVLGRAAAGLPASAAEDDLTYLPLPAHYVPEGNAFAVEVRGDSMAGAGVFDGDYVVVDRDSAVRDGEIAVIVIGGLDESEAVVRRLWHEGAAIRLESSNPDFAPIILGQDDAPVIEGPVVAIVRRPELASYLAGSNDSAQQATTEMLRVISELSDGAAAAWLLNQSSDQTAAVLLAVGSERADRLFRQIAEARPDAAAETLTIWRADEAGRALGELPLPLAARVLEAMALQSPDGDPADAVRVIRHVSRAAVVAAIFDCLSQPLAIAMLKRMPNQQAVSVLQEMDSATVRQLQNANPEVIGRLIR
jgi:SOS-response transcriptional repressor LexA